MDAYNVLGGVMNRMLKFIEILPVGSIITALAADLGTSLYFFAEKL